MGELENRSIDKGVAPRGEREGHRIHKLFRENTSWGFVTPLCTAVVANLNENAGKRLGGLDRICWQTHTQTIRPQEKAEVGRII